MKLSFLYAVALKFFIIYSSLAFYLRGARDGEGNGLGWGGKGGGGVLGSLIHRRPGAYTGCSIYGRVSYGITAEIMI